MPVCIVVIRLGWQGKGVNVSWGHEAGMFSTVPMSRYGTAPQLHEWKCTPALVMGSSLVFLLRGRKLFGDSWCWEASAGGCQRHADGQPPAGAGQAAPHGLPFVVLHMPVCVSHGLCMQSYKAIQKYCTSSNSSRTLTETLRTMDLSILQPFVPGQPKLFANFLNRALGLW